MSSSESISNLTSYLGPVASSKLGHALIGLVVLIIGLFIVKFISSFIQKMINQVDYLEKSNLTKPVGSLVKAILTIFVLMAVLQHFGLTNVLSPLEEMVTQLLSAVPKIIGAGVVGYAGWVIAKIVSQLVKVGLSKVDKSILAKTGNEDIKVSGFGSAFIFGGILLPISVAALGVLDIPAITEPASEMINKLMAAVPNIVGAGIILLVTYYVSKFVVYVLSPLLEGMGVNSLPKKLSAQTLFSESFTPIKLIGGSIIFFSMLTASTAAVNTLGINIISAIFGRILEFGGGLLIGGVILILGNFLGSLAHDRLSQGSNSGLANIARIAILGLVLAMGLKAMGLADNIVNMAFGFTLGSIAIAVALSFGLGGRDAAKTVADSWAEKVSK